MLDTVLLGLGVGVALWCALVLGYVVVQGKRDEARMAGLMQAFSDRLVALGEERAAARRA